jgi:hypothetical protein
VLQAGPVATITKVVEDVDSWPLGVLLMGLAVATTKVKGDIDGGPPGGAVSESGSGHQ